MNTVIGIVKVAGEMVAIFTALLGSAQRIKAVLEVDGSEFTVQLNAIEEGTLRSCIETERIIAEWKEGHP